MKIKKLKLSLLALLVLGLTGVSAQEAVSASGGNTASGSGTLSYSVGQVFYLAEETSGGKITEGVQQPFEIFVIISIEENSRISVSVNAYPNPTVDDLTLQVTGDDFTSMKYHLFDMSGKVIRAEDISAPTTDVEMRDLPAAIYFIKVIQDNNEIKTIKIIKE